MKMVNSASSWSASLAKRSAGQRLAGPYSAPGQRTAFFAGGDAKPKARALAEAGAVTDRERMVADIQQGERVMGTTTPLYTLTMTVLGTLTTLRT